MSQAPVAPVVRCSGVTKRYGDVAAVESLSFALQPGEILSILGPSGSGKTTVLRLIAGFESPDRGEIRIQGRVVSGAAVHVPPNRRNVGMVFQEYALFPHLTVAQNVSFGLRRMSREEREQRLAEVLALAGLARLEQRYPHELSGGQQQRVALARTIAPRPITVLLDEPFSNLDAGMRRRLRQEVADILRAHTIATVFVTHDREEAFAMADRIGVMNDGRLEQLDTPDRIYHAPATPFVAQLAGMCDFLPGEVRGGVVVTEIGNVPYAGNNGPLPEASSVDLLVRPDDVQVRPHSEGMAVVRVREFRGYETILVVQLPSGATVRCRQRSSTTLAPGAAVTLTPEPTMTFVAFPRAGGRPWTLTGVGIYMDGQDRQDRSMRRGVGG